MIYNKNGTINMDFLYKASNTFYLCTGHPIGFQKNLPLTDYGLPQPEQDLRIKSGAASLTEPYGHYLSEHITKISASSVYERKENTSISTFLPFHEIIITYPLFYRNDFKGTLYLGPFRINDITATQIGQLSVLNPTVDVINIKRYLESVPFINQAQIISFQYLLKIVAETETDIDYNFIIYSTGDISVKPFTYDNTSSGKHHSYHKEEKIIQELLQSEQSLESLVKSNFGYVQALPLATNDVLRSEKNRLIIMSALCCRGAIDLGVPSETAFSFADFFVLQLEEAKTVDEIPLLLTQMLSFFRKEVKKAKEENQYSKHTRTLINYIDAHIQQNLDLVSIARNLNLNYKYVSKLFREETGVNFIDYVYQKKIKLAKDILKNQNCKIEDISYYLGFSEPYYFSRVFKRYIGMTPSEYRKININF